MVVAAIIGAIIGGIIGCLLVELIRYLYAKWIKKHYRPLCEFKTTEEGMFIRPVGTNEWKVCSPYIDAKYIK